MHTNFDIGDNYDEGFKMDDYQDDKDFSYSETNRYYNAYGSYHGGYDKSNHGLPVGFESIGPMGPTGPLRSPGLPFPTHGVTKWRRGYPPESAGNMTQVYKRDKRDKIVKYLIQCGITRENVINLSNDVLWMMQPMHCGLCAQKFESNDLSRIHYASKNHLKNQKKWVNQRSNTGSHSREPLRSRDLYCELCDVHITSLGHADSHYAGKPHRSIVEGRKNPRNPFLLQPNKQGRLKALVRREMKFLKKRGSASCGGKKPDSKSTDLFCEICKTSMMCSEQMTTHLNGKRHLAKEKQHILRLMKGEVSDNGKKNASNKTAEDADQTEDMGGDNYEDDEAGEDEGTNQGGAMKNVDAVDDGWGEGGEDWKPSAEDY